MTTPIPEARRLPQLAVEHIDLLILHRPAPDRFEKSIAAHQVLALLANSEPDYRPQTGARPLIADRGPALADGPVPRQDRRCER